MQVNYLLIKYKKLRSYFFICTLSNIGELFISVKKIYTDLSYLKYIKSLKDYDVNKEIEIKGEIKTNINEKDIKNFNKDIINNCIICFCEIEKGKYLNCGHIFHYNCIKEWIFHYKKCPTCNSSIEINSNEKSKFYEKQLGVNNEKENFNNNIKDSINNNFDRNINNNKLFLNHQTKDIENKRNC